MKKIEYEKMIQEQNENEEQLDSMLAKLKNLRKQAEKIEDEYVDLLFEHSKLNVKRGILEKKIIKAYVDN